MSAKFPLDKLIDLDGEDTDSAFLTVPQLARLLHVNEKKVYQLAGCGEIPGTKVTGKWIFPRRLIDDWMLENSHGGVMHDRLLVAGSDDRLVHEICNHTAIDWQHHALISYSPSGTRHGLRMLDSGRIDACFMNWGASEDSARRHLGLLRCYRNHASWIVIRCLQRKQGVVTGRDVSDQMLSGTDSTIKDLITNPHLRWSMRQSDSGSERMLEDLCATYNTSLASLTVSTHCNSETSAVAAVNTGKADICCAHESAARDFNLDFYNVTDVSIDLVMSRKTFFRTLMQDFIKRLKDDNAMDAAKLLGGYNLILTSELVSVDGDR